MGNYDLIGQREIQDMSVGSPEFTTASITPQIQQKYMYFIF